MEGESGEKGKKLFQEAEEWIFERNSRWPFSFENICDGLGLDCGYLRLGLIRWAQKRLSSVPSSRHVDSS